MEEHVIKQLVNSPRESLNIELKSWIDPDSPEGKEKIVKACFAMRNNDSGFLLIGFNDNDGSPIPDESPSDVEEVFHIDKIQGLITKYASEAFEVNVYYPEIDSVKYVVIESPTGFKSPVATRSDLVVDNNHYIRANKVYVRSLESNNTPSTTEILWKDWPSIIERCFENREADIGRFIRRHLTNIQSNELNAMLAPFFHAGEENEPVAEKMTNFINKSLESFQSNITRRELELPDHGSMEVGVHISGSINEYSANREFMNLIGSINPRLTGWPMWIDSSSFVDPSARPFVMDGGWEALLANYNNEWSNYLDYWRILPSGEFYLYRGIEDDIGHGNRHPAVGTSLDFSLVILRVAESIYVALALAKGMGCQDDAVLHFIYRWRGLEGRLLTSWVSPERWLSDDSFAIQDEVVTLLDMPVDTARTAISGYVHQVISRLFEVFGGFELTEEVTDDLVTKLLERKL